jgi:hypothetical protein
MDKVQEPSHSKDLPLSANIQDITVTHFVLDLTLCMKDQTFSGNIILFCKPAVKLLSASSGGAGVEATQAEARDKCVSECATTVDSSDTNADACTDPDIIGGKQTDCVVSSVQRAASVYASDPNGDTDPDMVCVKQTDFGVPSDQCCKNIKTNIVKQNGQFSCSNSKTKSSSSIAGHQSVTEEDSMVCQEDPSRQFDLGDGQQFDLGDGQGESCLLPQLSEDRGFKACKQNTCISDQNDTADEMQFQAVHSYQKGACVEAELQVLVDNTNTSTLGNAGSHDTHDSGPRVSVSNASPFTMVLDCHKLNVLEVEGIYLDAAEQAHWNKPGSYPCPSDSSYYAELFSRKETHTMKFVVKGHCVSIFKEDVCTAELFPRAVRIWYSTQPDSPSLKWTKDQNGK